MSVLRSRKFNIHVKKIQLKNVIYHAFFGIFSTKISFQQPRQLLSNKQLFFFILNHRP